MRFKFIKQTNKPKESDMDRYIEVTNQAELEACVAREDIAVIRAFQPTKYGSDGVRLRGNASAVLLNDSCDITLRDNAHAELYGNAKAAVWDNATVALFDKSTAGVYRNARAWLYGKSRAFLYENARGTLFDKSSAFLNGKATAALNDNSRAWLYNDSCATVWGLATAALNDHATIASKNNQLSPAGYKKKPRETFMEVLETAYIKNALAFYEGTNPALTASAAAYAVDARLQKELDAALTNHDVGGIMAALDAMQIHKTNQQTKGE